MRDYLVKKKKKKKGKKEKQIKMIIKLFPNSELMNKFSVFTKIYKNLMDEKTPVGKNP